MPLDPALACNGMAELHISPHTGRVFAANKQCPIIQARNEYDAPILFHTQLIRSPRMLLHISPLRLPTLVYVEELIVASDSNLVFPFKSGVGKQTSGIGWKVILLVIPVLHPP